MFTVVKEKQSYTCTVYVAGQVCDAEKALRKFTTENPCCVSMTPTKLVYRYGAEDGVAVGVCPHPRYNPETPDVILLRARRIALCLMAHLHQRSAHIVTPKNTYWIGYEDENGTGESVGPTVGTGIGPAGSESA